MIKKIIRRNKQKLTAIFKEGRLAFPPSDFTNLTYLGKYKGTNLFAAKEGFSVGGIVTFVDEASWS
jgi:hypothetical protein